MSILINANTKVLVQGITGSEGSFHTRRMREYGTQIVAGVTPGKGGSDFEGIPVYNTVAEAVKAHKIDASAIFVPAPAAADAILEAADAQIPLIVCITEHIPVHQMLKVVQIVSQKGSRLIAKVGILPNHIFRAGPVGIVSRSGTLTYEIADQLSRAGIGQSTVVGIGGDPIIGSSFLDILELFQKDRQTKAVVLIGEIGGTDEERGLLNLSPKG
jgi:succinyl-CoA synthetase alpha subunit